MTSPPVPADGHRLRAACGEPDPGQGHARKFLVRRPWGKRRGARPSGHDGARSGSFAGNDEASSAPAGDPASLACYVDMTAGLVRLGRSVRSDGAAGERTEFELDVASVSKHDERSQLASVTLRVGRRPRRERGARVRAHPAREPAGKVVRPICAFVRRTRETGSDVARNRSLWRVHGGTRSSAEARAPQCGRRCASP